MIKTFVLDTNVLLHNAECIESFADNKVVLPMAVIEELDAFKRHSNELGRNARHVIRHLDALRAKGNLREGVPLDAGGSLSIVSFDPSMEDGGLKDEIPDNRILRVAYSLHRRGDRVVFVSKDINTRLKADALGLQAVDFEKQKVNIDELYAGYSEVTVPGALIDDFYAKGELKDSGFGTFPNEFIHMIDERDDKHSAIGRVMEAGHLQALSGKYDRVWNIRSRNREQRMALQLLTDPTVQLVTLVGQAGTGKTLLAVAAGLQAVLRDEMYERVLVSRPIVPLGKDLGYLPGGKEEKLAHWMQPIFDNMMYLLREPPEGGDGKKRGKASARDRMDRLLQDHVVELEALTYIRGRNIPDQFVIVDEAQNLTPHEIKTIVSRAGEGTKMVLTGDPYQIDNPYLDASSNGLTYAAERMKEFPLHGHVTLRTSERSALAAMAAANL